MSQFKKFNSSDNISNYDSSYRGREGELTWDPSNGLRLHDGNTDGGNPVGGSSGYPTNQGGGALNSFLFGGATSVNNGKFLMQNINLDAEWNSLPTVYDTLTADIFTANTKINGGLVNTAGEKVTGLAVDHTGSGQQYQQVFLGANQAFINFFNRGTSIVGWKIYSESDPGSYVTITDYLYESLGGPSLGFDTNYLIGAGPWTAESPDYNAGTPGPLTLAANTMEWVFGTDGVVTTPGEIVISTNNTHGGTGYTGFLTLTSTQDGVTNPNKFVRLNSTGHLQIVNSEYTGTIFDLADNGDIILSGTLTFPAGGTINVKGSVPSGSQGNTGDKQGMVAFDSNHLYYCKADYVDGLSDIWVRTAWGENSW